MATLSAPEVGIEHDAFPINGTDYVEFYVGNAKQASHYYRAAFGFQLVGVPRPRNGRARPRELPAAAGQDPAASSRRRCRPTPRSHTHVHRHGDGVRDYALWVDDAAPGVRRRAIARGAIPVRAPEVLRDEHGEVVIAAIGTYGDTIHSLVERRQLPRPVPAGLPRRDAALPAGRCRPQVRRPLRRQRRARPDEPLGRLLRRRDGLPQPHHLRRQRHQHRVLGADVEGDGQRQRPDQVPDQRAGVGQEEVADRGVPRFLRRTRRAAPRARHRRHPRAR